MNLNGKVCVKCQLTLNHFLLDRLHGRVVPPPVFHVHQGAPHRPGDRPPASRRHEGVPGHGHPRDDGQRKAAASPPHSEGDCC